MDDLQYKYLKNAQRGELKVKQLKVLEEGLMDTYRTGFDAGANDPGARYKRGGNIFSWLAGRIGFARGKAKRAKALSQGVISFLKALAKDQNFLIKFDKAAALAPEQKKQAFKEIVSGAHNVLLDISTGTYDPKQNPAMDTSNKAQSQTQANQTQERPGSIKHGEEPETGVDTSLSGGAMKNDWRKKRRFKEELYKGLKLIILDEADTSATPTQAAPITPSYTDKNVRIEPGIADAQPTNIKIDQDLANLFNRQTAVDYIKKIEKTNIWKTIGINSSKEEQITKEQIYKKYGIDSKDFNSYENSFQPGNKKFEIVESELNLSDETSIKQIDYELKIIFYNMYKELDRLKDSAYSYDDQRKLLDYLKSEFESNFPKIGSRLQNIEIFNKMITNNFALESAYSDLISASDPDDKKYYNRKFRESLSQPYVLESFKNYFKSEVSGGSNV